MTGKNRSQNPCSRRDTAKGFQRTASASGYPDILRTAPNAKKPMMTSNVWSKAIMVVVRDIRVLIAEQVAIMVNSGVATFNWDPQADATSFKIYLNPGPEQTLLGEVTTNTAEFSFGPGTEVTAVVTAVNAAGESAPSAPATGTT